jgi:hypothetical protein
MEWSARARFRRSIPRVLDSFLGTPRAISAPSVRYARGIMDAGCFHVKKENFMSAVYCESPGVLSR